MSTFDEPTSSLEEMADPTGRGDEAAPAARDGGPSGAATHEDVDRGNADGSTPSAQPREDNLAAAEARAEQEDADQSSAMGESGQDNGLNE